MNRLRIPVTLLDLIAIAGLACLAAGVALLVAPAAALVVVGSALLLYAVLATRSEVTS